MSAINARVRTQKGSSCPTVPTVPTEIRWLALLPDPVTGAWEPVKSLTGQRMVWVAPSREAARKQIISALVPRYQHVVAVVPE